MNIRDTISLILLIVATGLWITNWYKHSNVLLVIQSGKMPFNYTTAERYLVAACQYDIVVDICFVAFNVLSLFAPIHWGMKIISAIIGSFIFLQLLGRVYGYRMMTAKYGLWNPDTQLFLSIDKGWIDSITPLTSGQIIDLVEREGPAMPESAEVLPIDIVERGVK